MTAKRKAGTKKPSAAELKRQAAAGKQSADTNSQAIGELTELVKASLAGQQSINERLDDLDRTPTMDQVLNHHDQSERAINDVFGVDLEEADYPEKGPQKLPPHLQEAAKKFARNNPVTREQSLDTGELPVGQLEDRILSSTGPAASALDAPFAPDDEAIILESGKMLSKNKYDMEMFMQEQVLVKLHDTTDETAIPTPQSINGGRSFYFIRGSMQWVPRFAIEPLARAKVTTYTQRKVRLSNDDESYQNVPHTTLMYPFEVVQDTPQGKQWLRHIISEAY
jgi:hypothetical protein